MVGQRQDRKGSDSGLAGRVAAFPVILCSGKRGRAPGNAWRQGVTTCRQAHNQMPPSLSTCAFGCLGLGDCARACPHDALVLSPIDAPMHFPEACSGCGRCAGACPREIIRLLPGRSAVLVRCRAAGRKPSCCTRCGNCAKACPRGAIVLGPGHPRIAEELCDSCGACTGTCPVGLFGPVGDGPREEG